MVVVGAGMVAHRFVESLLSRAERAWRITVIGEEERHPYDRVGLTGFFAGASAEDLELDRAVLDDEPRAIRARRRRRPHRPLGAPRDDEQRASVAYDRLVLATGSYAARLAVDGFGLDGCFVYRTLDDVEKLRGVRRSAVPPSSAVRSPAR